MIAAKLLSSEASFMWWAAVVAGGAMIAPRIFFIRYESGMSGVWWCIKSTHKDGVHHAKRGGEEVDQRKDERVNDLGVVSFKVEAVRRDGPWRLEAKLHRGPVSHTSGPSGTPLTATIKGMCGWFRELCDSHSSSARQGIPLNKFRYMYIAINLRDNKSNTTVQES